MLLIGTYREHTTLKYYENDCTDFYDSLDAGYRIIREFDLMTNFDILTIDSFDEFPIRFLEGSKMNELHFHSIFEMSSENFGILLRIGYDAPKIFFHIYTLQYKSWIEEQMRMMIIRNIIT